MATALSSYFDSDFKSYFSYSTNLTNTDYEITVTAAGVWQDCTWSEYNWKTVLSATNYDSRTGSVGVTYWNSGYHALITADKTYTYPRKSYPYTVTISAKSTQVSSGKYATASKSFTVPALQTYKVTYYANGGSGAPSPQTKIHGVSLWLSDTVPTRSGYTFVGWGTSSTDTTPLAQPGEEFTRNGDRDYYAIWKKTITLTYNANGGSGAPSTQTATVYNATTNYTFSIPSTEPKRTGYTFLGWSKSSSATSASYTFGIILSSSDTLYAVWKLKSYTVKYSANGGVNAPSSQTKKYGTDLKLSSTKPTRIGYTFVRWVSTRSDGSEVYYAPGETVTYNGNQTLVAEWKLKTYTVKYNANGGSGAPSNQTKSYGTNLTLSSTKPTRQYHKFLGWSTSATATNATYSAGGTYKTNANVTLYAVWKVTYTIPRITKVSVARCDADGNSQDDGTYARLKFSWATDKEVEGITIQRKLATATSYSNTTTLTAAGTSGSINMIAGAGELSVESAYHYKITVTDGTDSNSYVIKLPAAVFPIDLKKGGDGVAIGEPAKETGFVVNMITKFRKAVRTVNSVATGGKTSYSDGLPGGLLGANGRLYLTGTEILPGVYLYHNQTSAGAYIVYDSTTNSVNVGGADLTVKGTGVSLLGHEHSWTKVTATAESGVKINSQYCAYNTALNMGVIRLALDITPTADIIAGNLIELVTLTGAIVPNFFCALSAYGSSNARRWQVGFNAQGKIVTRVNSELAKGTTYTVEVCGVYPVIV